MIDIAQNAIIILKYLKILSIILLRMCAEEAAWETPIFAAIELMMYKIITLRLTDMKWNPKILLH